MQAIWKEDSVTLFTHWVASLPLSKSPIVHFRSLFRRCKGKRISLPYARAVRQISFLLQLLLGGCQLTGNRCPWHLCSACQALVVLMPLQFHGFSVRNHLQILLSKHASDDCIGKRKRLSGRSGMEMILKLRTKLWLRS